jgi:hypothetical protein
VRSSFAASEAQYDDDDTEEDEAPPPPPARATRAPPAKTPPQPAKPPAKAPPTRYQKPAFQPPPEDDEEDDDEEEDEEGNEDDDQDDQGPAPYEDANVRRVECRVCHRKFAENRIGRHEKVCASTQKRKKKVFDARKQRLAGTDAAKFQGGTGEKGKQPKKSNFRAEHAKLIAQMRCARAVPDDNNRAGAAGRAAQLKNVEPEDDRVTCPHCNRKFAEQAAERHIPICERTQKGRGGRR